MDEKLQSYEWIATSCFVIGGIYLVVGSMSGSHFLWQAVGFEAVRECAELCLESGDPQLRASDYVTKLKTAGWSDNDVQEVLASALCVFARLVKHFRNGGA
jgi:hypothetical protein